MISGSKSPSPLNLELRFDTFSVHRCLGCCVRRGFRSKALKDGSNYSLCLWCESNYFMVLMISYCIACAVRWLGTVPDLQEEHQRTADGQGAWQFILRWRGIIIPYFCQIFYIPESCITIQILRSLLLLLKNVTESTNVNINPHCSKMNFVLVRLLLRVA